MTAMKKKEPKGQKDSKSDELEVITYRLDDRYVALLNRYAEENPGDDGMPLSLGRAARKLMLESLLRWEKKQRGREE